MTFDAQETTIAEPKDEIVFTNIVQTNGQILQKAFRYRVIADPITRFYVTVISPTSDGARIAMQQQYPNAAIAYDGVSTVIMQCQG